jgi:hypothetical protein
MPLVCPACGCSAIKAAIGVPMSADRRMHYFSMLNRDEQAKAIARLASSGMNDYGIASATGISVEMVRKILGEQKALEAGT